MPIHDWTRVSAGTFHDFHQGWTIEIRNRLNSGILPEGYYAMADQRVTGPEPDVIALRLRGAHAKGGLEVAEKTSADSARGPRRKRGRRLRAESQSHRDSP